MFDFCSQIVLDSIDFAYIRDRVFEYDYKMVIKRYKELVNSDLSFTFDYEEYKLLGILLEMQERKINYQFKDGRVAVL